MSMPFDRDAAHRVVSILLRAAEAEAAGPRRKSQLSDLTGPVPYESPNEKLERILIAAVTHGLKLELLILPDDIEARLNNYLVIDRPF
jgi:hypothetical protein